MSDPIDEIRRWNETIKALPPVPRAVRTHHSVPYGRLFRQYMANDDLILWMNRGEIADMPRATVDQSRDPWLLPYGIPIIDD